MSVTRLADRRTQQLCDEAREHVAETRRRLGSAFEPVAASLDLLIDAIASTSAKPAALYTRREAAALLRCGLTTFDRYVADGLLTAVILPSSRGDQPMRRWTRETLEGFIHNR